MIVLGLEEIKGVIPHDDPMLLIGKVLLDPEEGVAARAMPRGCLSGFPYPTKFDRWSREGDVTKGWRRLLESDEGNQGHFPLPIGPYTPAMYQLTVALEDAKIHASKPSDQLVEVKNLRMRNPVKPGNLLRVTATTNSKDDNWIDVDGHVGKMSAFDGSIRLTPIDPNGRFIFPLIPAEGMAQAAACAGMFSGEFGSLPLYGGIKTMHWKRPIKRHEPIQYEVGPIKVKTSENGALGNCQVSTWLLDDQGNQTEELVTGRISFALRA